MNLVRFAAALALCATPVSVSAADTNAGRAMGAAPATVVAGDIMVEGGFVRAMLPGAKVGGGYLTIRNRGGQPDRLVAVSSPSSGAVAVHEMTMNGSVMQMRALEGPLEIPAGETVRLQPGGMHLMFAGVSRPFAQGGEVALTLTFEKAGGIPLRLPVLAPAAKAADPMAGMEMQN